MSERVVLAYSGGLDTSVILKWLALQGLDVIAGALLGVILQGLGRCGELRQADGAAGV